METFLTENNRPIVTMGMPVYNEEKNLARAIESLLAQTHKNFILLISDNASTDRTREICEGYAKKDSRIRYVRQKENIGALLNFKFLVDQTKTPFFAWCSGNDEWDPLFIEKLMPVLLQNEKVILSYPAGEFINLDGTKSEVYCDDYTTAAFENSAKRYRYFVRRFRARISNVWYGIWRTQALKKCSLDLLVVAPDIIILYEAAFEGQFVMRDEVLYRMKKPDLIASSRQKTMKVFLDVAGTGTAKKPSPFALKVLFVREAIMIPFRKQYALSFPERIWLSANTFAAVVKGFFIERWLNIVFKNLMPSKTYRKLKVFYKRNFI